MRDMHDFDATVASWLEDTASPRVPDYVGEIAAATRRTPQRRGRARLERLIPFPVIPVARVPQPILLVLLLALVLAALTGALAIGAWRITDPFDDSARPLTWHGVGGASRADVSQVVAFGDELIGVGLSQPGTSTAVVWASSHGRTWPEVASMPSSVIDDVIVTRDGDLLAVGRSAPFDGAPEPRAWRSTDGRSWEGADGVPPLFYPAVEGDARGYVMVGRRSTTPGSVPDVNDVIEVWRSDDGSVWEATTLPAVLQSFEPFRLAAGEGGFVLTGCPQRGEPTFLPAGPDCFTLGSADGRTWTMSRPFASRVAVAPHDGGMARRVPKPRWFALRAVALARRGDVGRARHVARCRH